jgi:hypothetical protein
LAVKLTKISERATEANEMLRRQFILLLLGAIATARATRITERSGTNKHFMVEGEDWALMHDRAKRRLARQTRRLRHRSRRVTETEKPYYDLYKKENAAGEKKGGEAAAPAAAPQRRRLLATESPSLAPTASPVLSPTVAPTPRPNVDTAAAAPPPAQQAVPTPAPTHNPTRQGPMQHEDLIMGVGVGVFVLVVAFLTLVPLCLYLYSTPSCGLAEEWCLNKPFCSIFCFLLAGAIVFMAVALPQRAPAPGEEDKATENVEASASYRAKYGIAIPLAVMLWFIIEDYLKNHGEQNLTMTSDNPRYGLNFNSNRFDHKREEPIDRSNL